MKNFIIDLSFFSFLCIGCYKIYLYDPLWSIPSILFTLGTIITYANNKRRGKGKSLRNNKTAPDRTEESSEGRVDSAGTRSDRPISK